MNVSYIWEIPDQLGMRGGRLYDVYGNLTYFADTSLLVNVANNPVDKQVTVKAHTAERFMRDPAPYQRSGHVYERTFGMGQAKGAMPGYTVTFVSDAGLPNEQIRAFQYTGTLSALKAWLGDTAKMLVEVYGPRGGLSMKVPAATP